MDVLKSKLIAHFASYNKCFICNTRFTIDSSMIPQNQKTFYWKCPNCNAELKIGNPNYMDKTENEKQETLTDRDKLIKIMELPIGIRKLSEEEKENYADMYWIILVKNMIEENLENIEKMVNSEGDSLKSSFKQIFYLKINGKTYRVDRNKCNEEGMRLFDDFRMKLYEILDIKR